MNTLNCLSKIFNSSKQIYLDNYSRIVLMSDCHRGDGNWSDNFAKNQTVYYTALSHYYNKNYTYIELGDGDELWENRKIYNIMRAHSNVFLLLSKFFNEHRLYFIYGNHDILKKNAKFVKENFYMYFDEHTQKYRSLFKNLKIYEGLILNYLSIENQIFLIHGHQVDFFNYRLWQLSRFLVRYLWTTLETFGINDPTKTAKNYHKKRKIEKKLSKWILKEKHILISGHTHRSMFPEIGEIPYFNTGSCVHPRCITAIEISLGYITLVKWYINTKHDGTLFIDRKILAGPRKLQDYFENIQ